MELLGEGLILEVWVLVEVKVDLISAFDIVELLHFQLRQELQCLFVLLIQKRGDLKKKKTLKKKTTLRNGYLITPMRRRDRRSDNQQ